MRVAIVAFGLAALAMQPAALRADTRTYPGPAPCATTLQACIDGAASGDRIEIATTTRIDEDLEIEKGLTLTGAPGVTPIIGGGTTLRGVFVGPDSAASVLLQGLTVSNGLLDLTLSAGAGGSRTEVADCVVTSGGSWAVHVAVLAEGEIIVRDSRLAGGLTANQPVIDVNMFHTAGTARVEIFGNRVTTASDALSGIAFRSGGTASSQVSLYNNVIHDLSTPAIELHSGGALMSIVNNTIARVDRGLFIRPQSGGGLLVQLFNNIIANTDGAGVEVAEASAKLNIQAGFNDVFANGAPNDPMGYSLGTPLFTVDPQFVDPAGADFHLKPGSLLIDAGTEEPPRLSILDADKNARVAGVAVDLGAYEFGSSPPTTTTTLATTTTTLPPGCPEGASFPSARCRLGELVAAVPLRVPPGALATRLAKLAQAAADATARAEELAGKTRPRRKQLGRAIRSLGRVVKKLGSPRAAALDPAARSALVAASEGLRTDLRTLRAQ